MKRKYLFVAFVLASLLLYACSDDEDVKDDKGKDVSTDVVITDVITDTHRPDVGKDVSPDVEPDVVEDVMPDVYEDVLPDVGMDVLEDAGQDIVDTGPQEHKYNEEEPNSLDSPNKVELDAEINGQIDEPKFDPDLGYENDLDFYEFSSKAGDVLRIEAKALENMDIVPAVIIIDKESLGNFYYRAATMNMDSNINAGMTVFIPKDGDYLVVVGEFTNFGENPANVGGEKYKYVLSIKHSSLNVEALDLSSVPKRVSKTMPIDGPNPFGFSLSEEKYIKAETKAVRLSPPSDIDTVITLFNASKRELVEMADNMDSFAGNFDSLLLAYTGGGGDFYLIVESIIYMDQKSDYELDVDFLKMDEEFEPNDLYTNASALRIPSETSGVIGEPKDGEDENGNPIKVGDVDNFYFYAKAGDLYRFTIIAENGSPASDLDAYLVVYQVVDTIFGPWPVAINLNDNSRGKDSMVEALISENGKYFVFVADARNTSDNPNPVGGNTYRYKLKSEKISLVSKNVSSFPYSDSGNLDPAGAYKFYKFSGVKGDKFTIDVYQASGSNVAFIPFVVLYDADTYQIIDVGVGDKNSATKKVSLNKITLDSVNYLIGILDYYGAGGSDYKYVIDIKRKKLPYYDETEPNDNASSANEIKENHSLYFGAVDSDNDSVDMYKFYGKVGQVLNVALFGGKDPEAYDTVIFILDHEENVLASNEDYGGSYYSAIYGWPIPYDGTFYILVGPQADYGPIKGNYVLEFELINGCLPTNIDLPKAGDLVINEFYAYAKDDVNNDGRKDMGDQFVEIVNKTEKDLLIELAELRLFNNAKFKFPCGAVVPASGAVVVFGGGRPDGYFGGAKVYSSVSGLGLPSHPLLVVANVSLVKGQVEIDRIEYDAAGQNENTSFTRDPDITGEFKKHKDAANSNGALYSPGTRINGIPFVTGYAMFEIEPNNDMSSANVLPKDENRIVVFGTLKYEQGASDNDLDDYFKISLRKGQKLSLVTSGGYKPQIEDTTLILFDSNGNELESNRDISLDNYYSEIKDFEVPSDGDYYIDVQAETSYGDLPGTGYRLDIIIK
ncbi:MAG: pre-peptidase C-terminal domain-containing protein [Deltaproteobacteria bacterium]|nr:pre-peptidase C-terminal domain-containing protein [Deltaproteobacteria bacterium]